MTSAHRRVEPCSPFSSRSPPLWLCWPEIPTNRRTSSPEYPHPLPSSGYRVLERLRSAGVDTPALLLSARTASSTRPTASTRRRRPSREAVRVRGARVAAQGAAATPTRRVEPHVVVVTALF